MADQLPIIQTARHVTVADKKSTTLLGRGLAAIQSQKLAIVEQDKRYRQARDIYNRITDYGYTSRFDCQLMPKLSVQADLFEVNRLQPFYGMLQQLADVYKVFQQLADEGYGKAYFPLACMFNGGQGISKDDEKHDYYSKLAFDWYFANQALDDLEVWTDLGWMYDHFNEVEQDDENTLSYCNFIEKNHENAPINIWEWYETNGQPEDYEYRTVGLAMRWYRQAADRSYARAQYNVGFTYENNPESLEDFDVAVLWYREAAEQGYAAAQCNLGSMYLYGCGMEQADDNEAIFWFQKAAEQGHADAQFSLGLIYENGYGVEQDFDKAIFWYQKAAEQGCANAQYNLGNIWESNQSLGFEQNDIEAIFWYRKAAGQGHPNAQCNLGSMYLNGYGVEQDDDEAVFWYRKAAEQGDAEAQENLAILGINWKET
ncbi:tetratricopeptide repeat protein [Methylovulum miyakonense]|uniref:tetratricopeptide repeat protein n=1 Tax=Methylovulum miyakonense TaxID=645578 RepID=UPI00037AD05E|nr:tetratricopeptide repeat protein [Methylovulum miyakonense]